MRSVDLIPQYRRQIKARKAHLFKWVTGVAVYGVLLLLGYLASARYVAADSRPLDLESREVAKQLDGYGKTVTALSSELSQVQQKLRTAQAIGQQPDWSRLLALLSQNTDENIVLGLCRLRRAENTDPSSPKPPEPGAASDDRAQVRLILDLDGFAKAQSNVPEYMLRLEKTGLFDKVKLVKTDRQDFLNNKTVAFCLECTFRTHEGETK